MAQRETISITYNLFTFIFYRFRRKTEASEHPAEILQEGTSPNCKFNFMSSITCRGIANSWYIPPTNLKNRFCRRHPVCSMRQRPPQVKPLHSFPTMWPSWISTAIITSPKESQCNEKIIVKSNNGEKYCNAAWEIHLENESSYKRIKRNGRRNFIVPFLFTSSIYGAKAISNAPPLKRQSRGSSITSDQSNPQSEGNCFLRNK